MFVAETSQPEEYIEPFFCFYLSDNSQFLLKNYKLPNIHFFLSGNMLEYCALHKKKKKEICITFYKMSWNDWVLRDLNNFQDHFILKQVYFIFLLTSSVANEYIKLLDP